MCTTRSRLHAPPPPHSSHSAPAVSALHMRTLRRSSSGACRATLCSSPSACGHRCVAGSVVRRDGSGAEARQRPRWWLAACIPSTVTIETAPACLRPDQRCPGGTVNRRCTAERQRQRQRRTTHHVPAP